MTADEMDSIINAEAERVHSERLLREEQEAEDLRSAAYEARMQDYLEQEAFGRPTNSRYSSTNKE